MVCLNLNNYDIFEFLGQFTAHSVFQEELITQRVCITLWVLFAIIKYKFHREIIKNKQTNNAGNHNNHTLNRNHTVYTEAVHDIKNIKGINFLQKNILTTYKWTKAHLQKIHLQHVQLLNKNGFLFQLVSGPQKQKISSCFKQIHRNMFPPQDRIYKVENNTTGCKFPCQYEMPPELSAALPCDWLLWPCA